MSFSFEITVDPFVIIIYRGQEHTICYDIQSDEQWIIWGVCNQCGLCEIGRADDSVISWHKPAGEPFACEDIDYEIHGAVPIRPELTSELKPKCTYRGVYI